MTNSQVATNALIIRVSSFGSKQLHSMTSTWLVIKDSDFLGFACICCTYCRFITYSHNLHLYSVASKVILI